MAPETYKPWLSRRHLQNSDFSQRTGKGGEYKSLLQAAGQTQKTDLVF